MAKVTEKRPDGTTVVVVPPGEAGELQIGRDVDVRPIVGGGNDVALPWPFGALADRYPPFDADEVKAARREALRGKTG